MELQLTGLAEAVAVVTMLLVPVALVVVEMVQQQVRLAQEQQIQAVVEEDQFTLAAEEFPVLVAQGL